jgi:hypothetical protein
MPDNPFDQMELIKAEVQRLIANEETDDLFEAACEWEKFADYALTTEEACFASALSKALYHAALSGHMKSVGLFKEKEAHEQRCESLLQQACRHRDKLIEVSNTDKEGA